MGEKKDVREAKRDVKGAKKTFSIRGKKRPYGSKKRRVAEEGTVECAAQVYANAGVTREAFKNSASHLDDHLSDDDDRPLAHLRHSAYDFSSHLQRVPQGENTRCSY